jgi:hypothetical protein
MLMTITLSFVKITVFEPFLAFLFLELQKDNAKYFGHYTEFAITKYLRNLNGFSSGSCISEYSQNQL